MISGFGSARSMELKAGRSATVKMPMIMPKHLIVALLIHARLAATKLSLNY
jgi:hypothetical protein